MKKQIIAAAVAALVLPAAAVAHEAGEVIMRIGPSYERLDSNLGASDRSDTQFGLSATWMVAPHVGVEFATTTPHRYKSKIKEIGTKFKWRQVSPTIAAQYYFAEPKSRVQPYVGVGLNYTAIYNEKIDNNDYKIKVDDSWGLTGQVGLDLGLTDSLFINAAFSWNDVDMEATIKDKRSGAKVKAKEDADPKVFFLGVGFKF